MRFKTTFLTAAALALCALHACADTGHKLYYLDESRNVCVVAIGTSGKPTSTPKRLTSGGGYHGYSVSPDRTQVVAWKQIGVKYGEFPVYKFFLEKEGKPQGKILGPVMGCSSPWASWSAGCRHLIVNVPQQVEIRTIIYAPSDHRKVCDTTDLLPDFSKDQAYSFVLEDRGDADYEPACLSVLGMKTGEVAQIAQVSFGESGEPSQKTWFGESHKFAFIDTSGNLHGGEVMGGKSKPVIKKWAITQNAKCSDLRYIPGEGIYFVQKSGDTTRAYYSKDLRTLQPHAVLPVENDKAEINARFDAQLKGQFLSPDNLLYASATPAKPGELGMIRVYDRNGHSYDVAKGKQPSWAEVR